MDSAINLLNNWGLVDNTFHMWINYNLGKVNLKTTLAGQQVSPRQIGLCRVAAEVCLGLQVIAYLSFACFALLTFADHCKFTT